MGWRVGRGRHLESRVLMVLGWDSWLLFGWLDGRDGRDAVCSERTGLDSTSQPLQGEVGTGGFSPVCRRVKRARVEQTKSKSKGIDCPAQPSPSERPILWNTKEKGGRVTTKPIRQSRLTKRQ
ncbi:hypothetical protein BKA80DRAFT_278405 [Phyllosticta citrichinensis]